MRKWALNHAGQIATATIVVVALAIAWPHQPASGQLAALAAPFRFQAFPLQPADNGRPLRSIRAVHPALQHIDAWISSVGAGVALADIEGTGRPADICLVDPRNDSVSVMPAPQTGERYAPFTLPLPTDGYDPATIAPMGCLPADVNEDGRTDIVVYFWGRTPVVFLRTAHNLTVTAFRPVEIVAARERWNTNAALLTDVDGDGHPDLVFGNYFRDGDRILDPHAGDDVAMQHSMSRAQNSGRNRLLLWKDAFADGVTYEDASAAFSAEMADGWTLALAAADLNGDGRPEIYVANDFGSDRLLFNQSSPGKPGFKLVEGRRDMMRPRSKVLGRDSFKGMGVDFGDIDGGGRPAILVSNISETYALLESHFLFVHTGDNAAWGRGEAPYRDESSARGTWTGGWAWDVKFADLANTGSLQIVQAAGFIKGTHNRWPELQEIAMGNDELLRFPASWHRFGLGDDLSGHGHDRLLVADPEGHYHDIWSQLGLDRDTISRGIALGDVYGDGRLSVVIARQWMPSVFLRNVSPAAGRSLVLDVRLPGKIAGTRPAIDAVARVTLRNGKVLTARVDGGSGHGGRRAPEVHVGLGDAPPDEPIAIEITWRDRAGLHRQTEHLPPGRHRLLLQAATVAAASPPPQAREGEDPDRGDVRPHTSADRDNATRM
jgi:enediyne biosynthesis protein E4